MRRRLTRHIKAARDNSTLLRIENRSGVPFRTTTCLVGGACFVRFERPPQQANSVGRNRRQSRDVISVIGHALGGLYDP